jgi:hypothetical protein
MIFSVGGGSIGVVYVTIDALSTSARSFSTATLRPRIFFVTSE